MQALTLSSITALALGTLCAAAAPPKSPAPPTLPAPYATPSSSNGPTVIPQPNGIQLKVPAGFHVEEYARDFKKPRFLLALPTGVLLVTDSVKEGSIFALVDENHDGKVDSRKELLKGVDRPSAMALWKDYLYICEPTSIKRYKLDQKALTAGAGEEVVSLKDCDKGHWTRSIAFDAKGTRFYVGLGSGSNISPGDPEYRAAVLSFNPDGSGREIVATGIRNPVGLAFAPGTSTLWTSVQERDGLGDELVPDYFTSVKKGAFYGWPYAYAGPNEEPRNKGQRPDLVAKTVVPDVLLGAHVAVMDARFYTGKSFPAHYRGGAFLAYRGSSNRSQRIGYSIAFIPFTKGKPSGPPEDFLTGFMLDPGKKEVWGRPVGLAQLPDGSLVFSEDAGNTLWRVTYQK